MPDFVNSWLAGMNAGNDQVARAYSISDMLQQLQMARQRLAMSEEDQGFQREQQSWRRDDRARGLAERSGAQRYFAGQAANLGMFDQPSPAGAAPASLDMGEDSAVYPGPAGQTSDFGMHDAFGQMDPSMAATQVWHQQELARAQEGNATRLAVAQMQAAAKRQATMRKVAAIETHIRPKFGNAEADRLLDELDITGDVTAGSMQHAQDFPMRHQMAISDPTLRGMAPPGSLPRDDGMGPLDDNPVEQMPLSRMMTMSEHGQRSAAGQLSPEEQQLIKHLLMKGGHDEDTADAITGLTAMPKEKRVASGVIDAIGKTGETRQPSRHNSDMGFALNSASERARRQYNSVLERSKYNVPKDSRATPEEVKTAAEALDRAEQEQEDYLIHGTLPTRAQRKQLGGNAGRSTEMSEDDAVDQAWAQLGEGADPAAVKKLAAKIRAGGSGNGR